MCIRDSTHTHTHTHTHTPHTPRSPLTHTHVFPSCQREGYGPRPPSRRVLSLSTRRSPVLLAGACPLRSAQRHRVRPRCARHAQQAATGDRPARFECVRARRGGEAGPRSSRQAVGMPSIACRWLDAHAA
eukprot:2779156-Prymnesium_polylepis.1